MPAVLCNDVDASAATAPEPFGQRQGIWVHLFPLFPGGHPGGKELQFGSHHLAVYRLA